jgi:hypothetical protein
MTAKQDVEALGERLISWAQNEEMIDSHYTQHGRDCNEAAALLRSQADALASSQAEVGRLLQERDEYKIWWERDSTALGVTLDKLSMERACKEDFRALAATRKDELDSIPRERCARCGDLFRYDQLVFEEGDELECFACNDRENARERAALQETTP